MPKTAVIIGAGPAGLTAAYELLKNTNIKPIIYEATPDIGGISRTVNYKGNRLDIGGHRFFSKSKKINDWWFNFFPVGTDPEKTDHTFLIRQRLSRIFFLNKFFDYPVRLKISTLKKLGIFRIIKIGFSYLKIKIFPGKKENNLEDFFVNRFGQELYKTFFKDYTEKVWGIECQKIDSSWGAQRIKGLSIGQTLLHAFKKLLPRSNKNKTETSLIEEFHYPKLGPGSLWEKVAEEIIKLGGEIHTDKNVVNIFLNEAGNKITGLTAQDKNGQKQNISADYFLSSMPIKDLVEALPNKNTPKIIRYLAKNLEYRDFITVGLLYKDTKPFIPDNWLYIQEKNVILGRLQIFNNWSPYLVQDKDKIWLGTEYFCNENDELWNKPDNEMISLAASELEKIGLTKSNNLCDGIVVKQKKAYPAYFGVYERFSEIRNFLDTIQNLYPIGRNGQHRYNNMDHSMLTAMTAVDLISNNQINKDALWNVNAEAEYHEDDKNNN